MAKTEKLRLNVYLAPEIVNHIDEFASEHKTNRSVMISLILKNYIDQQNALKQAPSVIQKIEELLEQMKDKQ